MHYRDKARASMERVRSRNAKAVVFVEIYPLPTGETLYTDYSFFMNYVHTNPKWQAQTERDRAEAMRESHMYLYKNVLYYAKGVENYDECCEQIRQWHDARQENRISIYRLD